MSTLRDHLKKFHTHAASHHDGLAKCYGKVASFGKSAKSQMKDGDGDSLAECLQKIADMHSDASAFHKEMLAACEKSVDADFSKAASPEFERRLAHLENTLVPTKVSAVTPNAPGVRAVTRAGQPAFESKPNVPIQFEKLVAIEE